MDQHRNPGNPVEMELADGTWVRIQEYRTQDGGTFIIRADITERKHMEERFQNAFEHVTVGNIMIDDSGIIELFNSTAQDIFGYSADEMIGQNIKKLMPQSYAHGHDGYIHNYLETGDAKIIGIGREVRGLRKNGEEFPMNLGVGGIVVGGRKLFVGCVTDLSELKGLEQQLLRAQKMEAIGHLTGGVAHDFNNLLGIILGNAQLLEEKVQDDDGRDLLKPLLRATQRGAELTARLLAFSRQQPLHPQKIDINELCMEMTGLLKRSLGETIEINLKPGGQSPAHADPGQLENALLNLALNARDAMPGGGKLTIETADVTLSAADLQAHPVSRPGGYVVLKVSDTGTGIPRDVLDHVFEPFYTTKEVGAGSGLGLSMVYGFAEQSGGHVMIYSEEGRGTTVTLYLPQADAAAEDAPREAAAAPLPKGHGETVLVVEDEADLRLLFVQQLENLGYKTLQAPDGPEALEILADSNGIDLLLSDVVLPGGISGPEIFERIKERRPDLSFLLMTGYAGADEGKLPDGVGRLGKPFEISELAKMLRSALGA